VISKTDNEKLNDGES